MQSKSDFPRMRSSSRVSNQNMSPTLYFPRLLHGMPQSTKRALQSVPIREITGIPQYDVSRSAAKHELGSSTMSSLGSAKCLPSRGLVNVPGTHFPTMALAPV